jgi:hypothetical protein
VPSVVIRACFPVALLASIGGCATKAPPAVRAKPLVAPTTKADVWKQVASQPDADRIAQIGTAWSEALADARVHGQGDEVRHEGRLLVASAALARPAPTPGSYSCRLVEVGSTNRKKAAFERFKPFFCYVEVEGDLLTIVKQTGSQRPAGRLWEDDASTRLVYLGSLALGNEEQPKAYGEDPTRDMAGVVERVAPFVWRLVIPYPRSGARLAVFELTPVAEQPK